MLIYQRMRITAMPMTLLFVTCFIFSCKQRDPVIKAQASYFYPIEKNDVALSTPQAGEWLYEHKEKGQDLEAFKKSKPLAPAADKATIYLMPIGTFSPLQNSALQATRAYVEIFFQLRTVLLPPVPDSVPANASRQHDGHIQLLAPYILDSVLLPRKPKDAIALMAISAKDLYPKNDWNYVFGLASYTRRVGVSSIYRLQDEHLDTANFTATIRRLMNISSHEIGHMMSLHHCIHAKCVMNGTNSLSETDKAPLRLCAECQEKLYWNFRFDNKKRLAELIACCTQHGLQQDMEIFRRDREAIK